MCGVTASQVPLSWTANVSNTVVRYNVYPGTMTGGPYLQIASQVTVTGYTDTGMASTQRIIPL
jgi:hypothetical protein